MTLLECLIGIVLCTLLLSPLLETSASLALKQIEYEKTNSMNLEAERGLELIGRAIRMAGYRHVKSYAQNKLSKEKSLPIEIRKKVGFQQSDLLIVRHELSDGTDFDCIGNALTIDRTKQNLTYQGFLVDRQSEISKGTKTNGGSLVCQSLDRQGRLQNTTLMNGVKSLVIDELNHHASHKQRAFKVQLNMTDGANVQRGFDRIFTTRNLP
jgi:type II secretory pathway component PulJ